jgi:hypothetical protein
MQSLLNYNSSGKNDEALKDFFDLMRYLRMANSGDGPDHCSPKDLLTRSKSKGGY